MFRRRASSCITDDVSVRVGSSSGWCGVVLVVVVAVEVVYLCVPGQSRSKVGSGASKKGKELHRSSGGSSGRSGSDVSCKKETRVQARRVGRCQQRKMERTGKREKRQLRKCGVSCSGGRRKMERKRKKMKRK